MKQQEGEEKEKKMGLINERMNPTTHEEMNKSIDS